MSTPPRPTDAIALVESLDAQAIREQLAELDRQARALRVLLRSALVRERSAARRALKPAPPGEVSHA